MDIKRRREQAVEDKVALQQICTGAIQMLEVMRDQLRSMTLGEVFDFRRSHECMSVGFRCQPEMCEICEVEFRPHRLRQHAIAILRGIEVAWHLTWAAVRRETGMTQIQAIKAMRGAVSSAKYLGIVPRDPWEYHGDEFDHEFARWEKVADELKAYREQCQGDAQ